MKLSAIILLVGLIAVPVVLFVQFRWVRAPDFRRRRRRLLLGALFFFPLLAVAHAMAVKQERPPSEPPQITLWPEGPIPHPRMPPEMEAGPVPRPPPPPPPRPVERQEDCPPGTTLRAALCVANPRPTP